LPSMRETDALAVARARVVVDTRAGALEEAGDLLQAIAEGAIGREAISTELRDLLSGAGRRGDPGEITLFKSVGYALEDLVAARRVVDNAA
ncbi:ornithine cyclodeaminase family protein, partial [Pseudomonas aeruginosa]|nr:ornithine cyclodeaminase family protein [Pseudomonas aeruginosa]